jgi:CRISPR-associated protein Csd1
MILQALYEYYQRKTADPESMMPPQGWEWKRFPFILVIDPDGRFQGFKDTREGQGRARSARQFLVPCLGEGKGSGIKANLLWENMEYLFGIPKGDSDPQRVERQHRAFIEKAKSLGQGGLEHPAYKALVTFLDSDEPMKATSDRDWQRIASEGTVFVIEVDGYGILTEIPQVRTAVNNLEEDGAEGICLVSGNKGKIAHLHAPIHGVSGSNPTGAYLCAVNNEVKAGTNGGPTPAFASYMKEKGENAPVSRKVASAYGSALDYMLRKGSANRLAMAEATVVFWGEKAATSYNLESVFPWFFADPPRDDPDKGVQAVRGLFEAARTGHLPEGGGDRFFVLGLTPNAARLAVRFWKVGTVRSFADHILKHFEDFRIVHHPAEMEHLTISQVLRAVAFQGKIENVPPNLAGELAVSVLDGTPYPATLLQQCIRRIRAERLVTRARAAALKAVLNRFDRYYHYCKYKEVTVSLDHDNPDAGYRLGRLFAVLEKIQEEASGSINTTIRDRFYGAASSSPVAVFSQLLKLKNHHLAKLKPGRKVNMEKAIGEIMSGLTDFPAHLDLQEQARFAIGYYHQRQSFFSGKNGDAFASK